MQLGFGTADHIKIQLFHFKVLGWDFAVDTKTEKSILAELKRVRENKTTILIAHRISTVENMDKIIFIENGEISAVGKHVDLYNTNEAYHNMVELQRLEEEREGE